MMLMRLRLPRSQALFFFFFSLVAYAQARDGLCTNGFGSFQTTLSNGIKIVVGSPRKEGFASRFCSATINWGKENLQLVSQAESVDIDALGVDLGFRSPVLGLQVKNAEDDCFVTYNIYALGKPPRLVRTITGGSSFSAADTDLDGRVEIWTDDARAVNGIDRLSVSEMEFPPVIVLRFENRKLIDVSAEFQPAFDHQIAVARAGLDSKQLSEFKASDGRLSPTPSLSAEQMHVLRLTKVKVLEIVWAYLYSGREQQAWRELEAMWPPTDLERIRSAILNARNSGIESQVDVATTKANLRRNSAYIYETADDDNNEPAKDPMQPRPVDLRLRADSKPQAILLRRGGTADGNTALPQSEEMVEIVVDSAGKVRSAKTIGMEDNDLVTDCADWKFIPAFKDGHPVASRMRLSVHYLR